MGLGREGTDETGAAGWRSRPFVRATELSGAGLTKQAGTLSAGEERTEEF